MEPCRILPDHAVYFVTFTVVEWLPVFVSDDACQIVAKSLDFCQREKGLRINAYVIMPTHMHAILFDAAFDAARLAETMADLRKFTGRQLADYCSIHLPVFSRVLREVAGSDRKRQFWQPSRQPEAILSQWFWRQKLDYLHDNPCRKGLVRQPAHWRHSSAAYWLGEIMTSDVPLTGLEW